MRALVPELPRAAWMVLVGDALSAVGSGMTLPFLLVYLHHVRGLGLGEAGLAVSMVAVAGFAGNPIGGSLVDRVGGRATAVAGLVLSAVGSAFLAFVAAPWEAFAAAATLGFGTAVAWPARTALLATIVPSERRTGAFGIGHATMNVGLGTGAVLAALIVDSSSSGTFQVLYLLDAATFLVCVPIFLRLSVPAISTPSETVLPAVGYREILRDGRFLRLWALTALIVGVGYAQYSAAFPAFATGRAGLGSQLLALAFAANTFGVVLVQLPVMRMLRGRRRSSAFALVFVVTGIAWALVLAGAEAPSPAKAAAVFSVAMLVLAVGETILSPTAPVLANDLAPAALRGRYNGVYTLAWTTGFAAGPAVAGAVLAAGQANLLILGLIAACALGAMGSLRLAQHLPPHIDVVGGEIAEAPLPEPALA